MIAITYVWMHKVRGPQASFCGVMCSESDMVIHEIKHHSYTMSPDDLPDRLDLSEFRITEDPPSFVRGCMEFTRVDAVHIGPSRHPVADNSQYIIGFTDDQMAALDWLYYGELPPDMHHVHGGHLAAIPDIERMDQC